MDDLKASFDSGCSSMYLLMNGSDSVASITVPVRRARRGGIRLHANKQIRSAENKISTMAARSSVLSCRPRFIIWFRQSQLIVMPLP